MRFLFLPLFMLLLLCSYSPPANQDGIKETRKPGGFNELKIYGKFDVVLVKGTEEFVSLESDKVKPENVLTENDGGKLKIRMKVNYFQDPEVKVVVTYRELNHLSAGAGARVDAGSVRTGTLVIKSGSGSDIKAEVFAEKLETDASQGAGISLSGTVNSLDATVNTGGQLVAFPLTASTAKVKVTMGGYAKVTATDKLDAIISMGGNISYKGKPGEVKRTISMGGTITEMGD